MVQQAKNKNKLYLYKVFIDFYNNSVAFKEFNVWAYSEEHALKLISNKFNYFTPNTLKALAHITIYKQRLKVFICKLFNKVPEYPICTQV